MWSGIASLVFESWTRIGVQRLLFHHIIFNTFGTAVWDWSNDRMWCGIPNLVYESWTSLGCVFAALRGIWATCGSKCGVLVNKLRVPWLF